MKGDKTRAPEISSSLDSGIQSMRGGGQPLPKSVRAYYEPRFGHDFSKVRVHTDSKAAESASNLNAKAYTAGQNIVFGAGNYSSETLSGKQLLAHELTHVVQQTGQSQHAVSGSRIMIQRTPGKDSKDSWKAVIDKVFMPKSKERKKVAAKTISRFLTTKSGSELINSLWWLFCKGKRKCSSKVIVKFVVSLPKGFDEAGGTFEPDTPDQPLYTVWIKSRKPESSDRRSISLGGTWPGGSPIDFVFLYTDPESHMSSTLHHELLHVWFIHARREAYYHTGHGAVMKGEIEPEFLKKLKKFSSELAKLEGKL